MGSELEVKYAAKQAALTAIRQDETVRRIAVREETIPMETTYYDTPSGELSARKWMLRIRREGERSVVTMKTSGDGQTRGEWEYEAETLENAAETLTALGAPTELKTLLQAAPIPVCGARFQRRAILLRFSDGSEAELALDEGILFREGRTLPLTELELERKHGSEREMLSFAAQLAETYQLKPEARSKFQRAAAL